MMRRGLEDDNDHDDGDFCGMTDDEARSRRRQNGDDDDDDDDEREFCGMSNCDEKRSHGQCRGKPSDRERNYRC